MLSIARIALISILILHLVFQREENDILHILYWSDVLMEIYINVRHFHQPLRTECDKHHLQIEINKSKLKQSIQLSIVKIVFYLL